MIYTQIVLFVYISSPVAYYYYILRAAILFENGARLSISILHNYVIIPNLAEFQSSETLSHSRSRSFEWGEGK